MATLDEIGKAFRLVYQAGLEFPPAKAELTDRLEAWNEFLADIPADALIEAARKIVLTGERFPSVPHIRKVAEGIVDARRFNQPRIMRLLKPPAYMAEHDRLKMVCGRESRLPTDDELYALEKLRGIRMLADEEALEGVLA